MGSKLEDSDERLSFRLTIRNVNEQSVTSVGDAELSFRLTIRNVNSLDIVGFFNPCHGFRLTIRNVNVVVNIIIFEFGDVLD